MKVKIINCSQPNDEEFGWYLLHIGREFEVREIKTIVGKEYELAEIYLVNEGEFKDSAIRIDDCEIIVPSNHSKAIKMFAACDGDYGKQIEMIESLISQSEVANEKLKHLNEIVNYEKQ